VEKVREVAFREKVRLCLFDYKWKEKDGAVDSYWWSIVREMDRPKEREGL
jgi:hypothetical protein